jgi:hypothetical protein
MKCLCMSGAIGWSRYADKSENKNIVKEVNEKSDKKNKACFDKKWSMVLVVYNT